MSLTAAAASGFVVFLLSVQVIQGKDDVWGVTYNRPTVICASEGSTVEIHCSYTYPSKRYTTVQKTFWFTKWISIEPVDLKTDSEYSGRVFDNCNNKFCTLTITNLRESDSAVYKFRFITNQDGKYTGEPGVKLFVTGPGLTVKRLSSSKWLKCLNSCPLPDRPSYIWYKNGQEIQAGTSSYYLGSKNEDSYSCAVKGYEDFPSPPECHYGPSSCNRVTYTERSICASKGSSVNISCTYNGYGYITSKFWFSPERGHEWRNHSHPEDLSEDSQYTGRVQVIETERGRSTLRITNLREMDSAQYRFKFKTQTSEWGSSFPCTTLTVTALQVQVTRLRVGDSKTEVDLKCQSSCSPAGRLSYVWFKNGTRITWEETSSYKGWLSLGDVISCALNGYEEFPSPSVYAPKRPSVSVSPSGEIVEGSSVTLTCRSDANPAARYTWYKNGKLYLHPLLKEQQQLVFSPIQSSDCGRYHCTAGNKLGERTSEYVSIDVKYPPKLPSVSVSSSGEIVEGSSVTLTCSSDANPAADYTWYKNGNLKPLREEPQLLFSPIQSSDSGDYYCTAENELGERTSEYISINVKYPPKLPSVSVSPSGEIVEGSSVTLTCSSDANPAADYTWYKNGNFKPLREEPQLVFSSIQSSDSGDYHCTAENELGRTSGYMSVDVKYAPKLPSVSVSPSGEIVEGSSVTLTCSSDANPAADYTWYKNGNLKPLREEPQLLFSPIQSSDSGDYYCTAENELGERTSEYISINVKYPPKLPSVSVSSSGEIVEGSSVTLTCSSDANPAADYTWYKNGNLKPLREEPQLIFSSIQSSDSGDYYCTAENELGERTSEYISINVKYAPKRPSVSVSPSGEIVEGSSVTLTCSSDANPAADYTWYKNGNLKPLREEPQLLFSSIQSFDSEEYYCLAENDLRTMRSKSIFINVKYAPKLPSVSVSPSGEIVEGSSVTLTCSSDANPAANYTWYKENQTLLQGPEGIYHFTSISSEDRGIYYCKSDNQHGEINSTSLSVDVQYAPKLPSVSVSPSGEIVEGSSVTLTCSSDANPAARYTWYKENEDSPEASGQIFTITDLRAEHSGNYYCEAQNNRGRHNSTLHLSVAAGAWKLIAAAATGPAAFLTIIFVSVILWIIKKRSCKQPSEPRERPDNREQMPPTEQQDELHYASVHFSRRETDPLYSNIRPAQPRRYKEERKEEEEEEMVVYAAVGFNSASPSSRGQEASEDPAALYSTVNKKRNL
ncbi:hemicentin-2-like isoform X2 [Sebastes umbrosus]|uniref:hemicentin-2-like isoform X2 n=1 Tax=Sebastes umbrosus TaxID=72105 RepID=UPI00189E4B4F|nr:hemicentin-2-like isoform X2 [Sebastes umbrosus]